MMTVQYGYARKQDYILYINRLRNLTHNTVIRCRDPHCSTSLTYRDKSQNFHQTLRQTTTYHPDGHAASVRIGELPEITRLFL